MKRETIADFIARGGQITVDPTPRMANAVPLLQLQRLAEEAAAEGRRIDIRRSAMPTCPVGGPTRSVAAMKAKLAELLQLIGELSGETTDD